METITVESGLKSNSKSFVPIRGGEPIRSADSLYRIPQSLRDVVSSDITLSQKPRITAPLQKQRKPLILRPAIAEKCRDGNHTFIRGSNGCTTCRLIEQSQVRDLIYIAHIPNTLTGVFECVRGHKFVSREGEMTCLGCAMVTAMNDSMCGAAYIMDIDYIIASDNTPIRVKCKRVYSPCGTNENRTCCAGCGVNDVCSNMRTCDRNFFISLAKTNRKLTEACDCRRDHYALEYLSVSLLCIRALEFACGERGDHHLTELDCVGLNISAYNRDIGVAVVHLGFARTIYELAAITEWANLKKIKVVKIAVGIDKSLPIIREIVSGARAVLICGQNLSESDEVVAKMIYDHMLSYKLSGKGLYLNFVV